MGVEQEKLTEFEKWLQLFKDYAEVRGRGGAAWKYKVRMVERVHTEMIDVMSNDIETIEKAVNKNLEHLVRRREYISAVREFKWFMSWVMGEGSRLFKQWLLEQGYSEHTVKMYYFIVRAPAERINKSKHEFKKWVNGRKAFKRFMAWYFSGE